MKTRTDREHLGPSWMEVILGIVLSFVLGVALAAAFLIFKPVAQVKEMPKEPEADQVYFVAGSADAGRARQAAAKAKAFAQGGSVVVTEDELNFFVAPDAAAKTAAAAPAQSFSAGVPNFRVRKSVLQIAVPLRIGALGLDHEVLVQARGGFEKQGDGFVFTPTETYLGSCPVQNLPALKNLLLQRLYAGAGVSEEMVAAWQKLSDVAVEDSTVRLTTQ